VYECEREFGRQQALNQHLNSVLIRSASVRALRLFVVEEGVAEEEGIAEEGIDSWEGGTIIRISGSVLVLGTVEC
jgi:hypothetical protein